MSKDDKGKAKSGEDDDRPTVAPPFDPAAFAKEALKPSPAAGTTKPLTPPRAPMPTLTDEAELEEARLRSAAASDPPKPRRKTTPTSTISLANARAPSVIPPRKKPPSRRATRPTLRKDDAWETQETKPPPAMTGEEPAPFSDIDVEPPTQERPDVVARTVAEAAAARDDERPAPPSGPPSLREMNDRVALGDYTGALDVAERLLAIDAKDEAARACAERCRDVLIEMYTARIGPLDRVPVVMVARDQLRWLSIDHRAGFVLSLIDGVSSLEMLLDVSGMPVLDALRILSDLAQQRIISFR